VNTAPWCALPNKAKRAAAALALAVFVLAGCGKSGIVAVRRPLEEIRVCDNLSNSEWGCRHEFDAGSLVAMSLPAARELAHRHGYIVRRVAPLARKEAVPTGLKKDRIDVETNAPRSDSMVVRFVGKG
jgi:hypothetical protein